MIKLLGTICRHKRVSLIMTVVAASAILTFGCSGNARLQGKNTQNNSGAAPGTGIAIQQEEKTLITPKSGEEPVLEGEKGEIAPLTEAAEEAAGNLEKNEIVRTAEPGTTNGTSKGDVAAAVPADKQVPDKAIGEPLAEQAANAKAAQEKAAKEKAEKEKAVKEREANKSIPIPFITDEDITRLQGYPYAYGKEPYYDFDYMENAPQRAQLIIDAFYKDIAPLKTNERFATNRFLVYVMFLDDYGGLNYFLLGKVNIATYDENGNQTIKEHDVLYHINEDEIVGEEIIHRLEKETILK